VKHFVYDVGSLDELKDIVKSLAQEPAVSTASALLFHAFTFSVDINYINEMKQIIKETFPKAVIVGASSVGQIIKDKICTQTTALSVMCFEKAQIRTSSCSYNKINEKEMKEKLSRFVAGWEDLQGVEMLVNVKDLANLSFLNGLNALPENIPVFGCGADADNSVDTLVFDGENNYTHGAVAVAYCGEDLHIAAHISVGWKTLGRSMTITGTDANGMTIETIDEEPAVDVYKKYLKIENNPQFASSVQEFPLIVNRYGHNVARVAVSTTSEGAIKLGAKVETGNTVRIGYADPSAIISAVRICLQQAALFHPQALLTYSCITRKIFLKEYANEDNKPFNFLAPVCGFHTFGEIYRQHGHVDILNCTMVSVAFREGDVPAGQEVFQLKQDEFLGHMSLVQRLVRFVEATSLELEEANKQLLVMATHDQLTKLLNRGEIERCFKKELQRAARGNEKIAILMLDIDDFKKVNDTLGHAAGDEVLRKVASILSSCVRGYDLVGRWGGEEFLILLLNYGQLGAVEIAERIRKAVANADFGMGREVTVSLGVTIASPQETMAELYRRADAALYEAKAKGKNCVVQK
jgi:diguanylate cyclase (GGDEF)-like protein